MRVYFHPGFLLVRGPSTPSLREKIEIAIIMYTGGGKVHGRKRKKKDDAVVYITSSSC